MIEYLIIINRLIFTIEDLIDHFLIIIRRLFEYRFSLSRFRLMNGRWWLIFYIWAWGNDTWYCIYSLTCRCFYYDFYLLFLLHFRLFFLINRLYSLFIHLYNHLWYIRLLLYFFRFLCSRFFVLLSIYGWYFIIELSLITLLC